MASWLVMAVVQISIFFFFRCSTLPAARRCPLRVSRLCGSVGRLPMSAARSAPPKKKNGEGSTPHLQHEGMDQTESSGADKQKRRLSLCNTDKATRKLLNEFERGTTKIDFAGIFQTRDEKMSKLFNVIHLFLPEYKPRILLKGRGLTKGELKGCKLVFEQLDADGSGGISCEELERALIEAKFLDVPISPDRATDLVAKADTDGDGNVDFIEVSKFCCVDGCNY